MDKKEKFSVNRLSNCYKGDEIDILINSIKGIYYLNSFIENYLKKEKLQNLYITRNVINNDLLAKYSSLYP